MLDSGVLGEIAAPPTNIKKETLEWVYSLLAIPVNVFVPEIVDYECRRDMIQRNAVDSIKALDELKRKLEYLPLDTDTMLLAADLWAAAVRAGRCRSDDPELNVDAILAAQARRVGAIVATYNPRHLAFWVDARPPSEIR